MAGFLGRTLLERADYERVLDTGGMNGAEDTGGTNAVQDTGGTSAAEDMEADEEAVYTYEYEGEEDMHGRVHGLAYGDEYEDSFGWLVGGSEGEESSLSGSDDEMELWGRSPVRERGDGGQQQQQQDDDDSDDDADVLDAGEDVTARQAGEGRDIQGIPWERLHFTRDKYRQMRLQQYKNYKNLDVPLDQVEKEVRQVETGARFYDFAYNTRAVKSTIVHFQLRNLLWATSKQDVYSLHHHAINHYSPLTHHLSPVLDVSGPLVANDEAVAAAAAAAGGGRGVRQSQPADGTWEPVGRVQVSTMCVRSGLVVAGGFHGEMVCKSLHGSSIAYTGRITRDESAITNAVDIFHASSGAVRILTSNNDKIVREFDAESFAILSRHHCPWPVNHTSVSPDGSLIAVVGDDPAAYLLDSNSGKVAAQLQGHVDYSFATAWHPNGLLLATGNQDTTCRIWDARRLASSLFTLKGRLGAIRSIRFSNDGRFMMMAEPADFVHVFDTRAEFARAQEIDLFGEVAGVAFSPDTEALFVAVADRTYSSLLEFSRARTHAYLDTYI